MITQLEQWDKFLFKLFNGIHNELFDLLMAWISNKWIWMPLYAILLYWLFRYHSAPFVLTVTGIILLILISDQTASGILKPWIQRLRPCYDPELEGYIHIVNGCGGPYGFASSHASNSFAIAFFCWYLLKKQLKYIWLLIPWASLVAYSRIYLGVHFPGDIIAGALIGIGSASLVVYLLRVGESLIRDKACS